MSVPEQIGAVMSSALSSTSASSSSAASSATPASCAAPRWVRRTASIGAVWASTLALFALWALCTRSAPDTRALPSPGEVAAAFVAFVFSDTGRSVLSGLGFGAP